MRRLNLEPTDENILKSLQMDSLDRRMDVFCFIDLLNSIQGNYVIALDGNWGLGKTFFVKQVKCLLDAQNDLINENYNN